MGNEDSVRDLREQLAALEHDQWIHWTQAVAEREDDLPDHLVQRWEENWKPYEELDDDVKEHDRKWARKVIDILEQEGILCDHTTTATADEIREWEEEHDEPHPCFRVEHRPERISGDTFYERRHSVVGVHDYNGNRKEVCVCALEELGDDAIKEGRVPPSMPIHAGGCPHPPKEFDEK